MNSIKCPCGSDKNFQSCCEPLIDGQGIADSPESLMRSRYVAFSLKKIDYIFATLDPQARSDFDRKTNQDWAESSAFTKLEIIKATNEGNKGTVEFKAHYQSADGQANIHHEFSKFRKQNGVWYFREGKTFGSN